MPQPKYLNAQAGSTLLVMSPRRLQGLAADGVIPKAGRGKYELVPIVQAYVRYLRDDRDGGSQTLDYRMERARKERAQADKIEFELAIARKEYVHISHVERVLEAFATAVAARFDGIVSRLKHRYPDLKPRVINGIEKEVAAARNEVASLRASKL